jgi:hypothetical protein
MSKYDKDMVTLEDGFKYFWYEGRGAFSANDLRNIADRLDELNEGWWDDIENYFEGERR